MGKLETVIRFHLFPSCPSLSLLKISFILSFSHFFSWFSSWSLCPSFFWNQFQFGVPASFPHSLFWPTNLSFCFSKYFIFFLNLQKYRPISFFDTFFSCLLILYHTYFILINMATSFDWLIFRIFMFHFRLLKRFYLHYMFLMILTFITAILQYNSSRC